MAKKGPRGTIMLESTAGTGTRVYSSKNSRNTTEKLEIMKYDRKAKKHVLFKEGKMK